jgi:hypothetical protein
MHAVATLEAPAAGASAAPADPVIGAALTQNDLDRFARDGYLPGRPLIDPAELPALRAEYDRLVSDKAQELSADPQRRMLQIVNAGERSALFNRLRHHPAMLAVITDLIGPNVLLFHDQILFKPARDGGVVPWHQDNGYWRSAPANLVSCWITLDDADAGNGAMQVIPGSHLVPARHGEHSTRLLDTAVDATTAITVPVPAGWGMFHHCQTLHHTGPNDSDRPRRAFAVHCMLPGTRDREGKIMRAGYTHPMLCSG